MILVNRLTKPGGIRRLEVRADFVKVTLADKTERLYPCNEMLKLATSLITAPDEENESVNGGKHNG